MTESGQETLKVARRAAGPRQYAKRALDEARRSPLVHGAASAAAVATAAVLSGVRPRQSIALASAVGLVQRELRAARLELQREVRSVMHAPSLAAYTSSEAVFGDAAIEPDLGRLIVEQLRWRPRTVVECGCGASTLLIGALLKRNGTGRLLSIENDPDFARHVARQATEAGLDEYVEVIVAPLRSQQVGPETVDWYDLAELRGRIEGPVDLLLVDGPPSAGPWARWPALEVFHDRLASDATVLLDDGRRGRERKAALRWERSFSDVDLYWVDTVKGTWKVVRRSGPERSSRAGALVRKVRRGINPRPQGYGLSQIRR